MNKAVLAAILILVIGAASFAVYIYVNKSGTLGPEASNSLLNSRFSVSNLTEHSVNGISTYSVYIANTPSQQEEGYMNVSTTGNCDNRGTCLGMVFVFKNYTNQCFWMKNTAIALRQTWINQSGYPVYSYVGKPFSLQPICSYGKYVIETMPNASINGYITLNG